ncbi:MAG: DNA polymerase III subunit delta [Alphaproteobacteria bacterium]|nr:DNA polymerase III subunit delta [Alphaproteobacteria bacterium]
MKIAPKAMAGFLQAPDQSAWGMLLYGPDEGLAQARLRQARGSLAGASQDMADCLELSAEQLRADPALLADELAAFSLLGGRRVVLVRDAGDKTARAVEAALEAQPVHYLIMLAGELSPRSSLRQLFESHTKLAALPCYKDEAADVSGVIRARLNGAGVRLQAGVLEYLAQQLGNDRGITLSELEKIVLYAGEGGELALEEAQALVGHNKEALLDELALAVAGRQAAAADRQQELLMREGASPVAVLRAVQRHFQRLYAVRAEADGGVPVAQAVAALKPPVFFRQVGAVTQQAEGWSRPALGRALAHLARAEAECKSGLTPPALACGKALSQLASL